MGQIKLESNRDTLLAELFLEIDEKYRTKKWAMFFLSKLEKTFSLANTPSVCLF